MKKILKAIVIAILVIAALAAVFFAYLTAVEFRPEAVETVEVTGRAGSGTDDAGVVPGASLTVATWNIGYGALGDNADFFMDGGKMVTSATKERVGENLAGISETLSGLDADVIFLQEVDLNSSRSYGIDEASVIRSGFAGMSSAFATNFKVTFVPYPIPPIGRVSGGIMTLAGADISEAQRISLPCPFSWPVRLANLKRCLLVTRIPAGEDGRELVLVNLHLEAYDDGEGKEAQTKVLKEFLEQEAGKGNYVIAGGDFNQSFPSSDSAAYALQEGKWAPGVLETDDFGDRWQILCDTDTPTCRSLDQPYEGADKETFQYYAIDGFIISVNVEAESVETLDGRFRWTDHNPVVIKIKLKS